MSFAVLSFTARPMWLTIQMLSACFKNVFTIPSRAVLSSRTPGQSAAARWLSAVSPGGAGEALSRVLSYT
eukprot:6723660-Pyramimonas_sp.AAC.1